MNEDRLAQGLVPTDYPAQRGYNDDYNNNSDNHSNNFRNNNYNNSAPVPVRVTAYSQYKLAETQCKSEALGPAWNGSFASNSPDGIYEPTNRTCTWTIQATTSTNPTIVGVHFTTPIQLICG